MKVAIYCRVSTDDQTTENQKRDLIRYCESRHWDYVVFEDTGISGSVHDRPALDAMMKQARQRKVDMVLVARFCRFARSTEHLLSALNEFRALGVDFISLNEGIDTSTPMGKMIFVFLSAIYEFERAVIQSRVRSGIARAKAEGTHCGRPAVEVDIEQALQLRRQGASLRGIAQALGVGCGTVHRALMESTHATSSRKEEICRQQEGTGKLSLR